MESRSALDNWWIINAKLESKKVINRVLGHSELFMPGVLIAFLRRFVIHKRRTWNCTPYSKILREGGINLVFLRDIDIASCFSVTFISKHEVKILFLTLGVFQAGYGSFMFSVHFHHLPTFLITSAIFWKFR